MGNTSAHGTTESIGIKSAGNINNQAQDVSSKLAMAGILMNENQPDKGLEKLPSQASVSSYRYTPYRDPTYTQTEKGNFVRNGINMGVHTPDSGGDVERRIYHSASNSEPPAANNNGTPATSMVHSADKRHKSNGNPSEKTSNKGPRPNMLPRLSERQIQAFRSRSKRRLTSTLNPLVDPRVYANVQTSDPKRTYHDGQMRRSMHRLVSATSQFDRVAGKSLSLLADISRLYLLRIGEACRARADFANRIEPNLFDVMDGTAQDMGIDWTSIVSWVGNWKDEVGQITQSASSNEEPWKDVSWDSTQHTDEILSRRMSLVGIDKQLHHGMSSDHEGSATTYNADTSNDIDSMINSLNLSCLLLDGMDMAEGIRGVIPSHLPPLVPIDVAGGKDEVLSTTETGLELSRFAGNGALSVEPDTRENANISDTSTHTNSVNGDGDGLPESEEMDEEEDEEEEADESPEAVIAQLIHITSSSLSVLPTAVKADSALYGFFRPATKFDSSCAPDEVMPDFDIPETAFVPAPERISSDLSLIEKIEPGHPMFLIGDMAQRDIIGDSEDMWRRARCKLYQNIHDKAADQAIEEMSNAPVPVRRRAADDRVEEEEERKKELEARKKALEARAEGSNDVLGLDVNIEDIDVVDMDMGMDIDLDTDLELDIDSNSRDNKSMLSILGADQQKGSAGHSFNLAQNTSSEAVGKPNTADENAEPDAISLPITSGLRGSGKRNWSNEWFTEAMRKRLGRINVQDITPCDSLFLSNPWVSHRSVVDEVARAFVDSEGGGHLHETTPLEGFGPAANTYVVPSSSGSALRWTLQHLMQTKGTHSVESLYTGRSSLAGGISGDGVIQYIDRMCSLIRASAEDEAEMVVKGALRAAKDKDVYAWANRKVWPGQIELMEQLLSGAEKRIPWAQNRLDIHVVESQIVGREPQNTERKGLLPIPLASAGGESVADAIETAIDIVDAADAEVVDIVDVVASGGDVSGNSADDIVPAAPSIQHLSIPHSPPHALERRDSITIDVGSEVFVHHHHQPAEDKGQDEQDDRQMHGIEVETASHHPEEQQKPSLNQPEAHEQANEQLG
ncbi:hypothetical protein GGI25_000339 [Coemansia spiralis]|uniref:Bromodomain associated domain-containing protein n=2 Tax=Coemansia TaxID=4863 RepID=A0A9W8GCP7_9FUNG|nr:hypothetical protein EDC05_000166 [Coemansia umbellata]KAJ2625966.1 hypothetical protein GGI26_000050 [Coemansia sp. RSA 1358]KAJ2680704.1 hypothetical protein GGI25_000339 [Coemansia spiralis]